MAQIVETIIGDRRIQLGNEEMIRQMSFGSKWSKLRIIVRFSINGTANITAPEFVVGVCCGLTNGYKSSNTDFVFGLCIPGFHSSIQDNLNYNAGPPAWYQSSDSIGYDVTWRTGNTTTKNHPTGVSSFVASTANNPPACLAVDIVRIGTVYSVPAWYCPNSQAQVQAGNTQKQQFIGADSETGSPWSNMTQATLTSSNSVSDPHMCDCVTVFWSKASPTAEISDLQVVRFA